MIEKIKTIESPADTTYKDKEVLELDLTLDNDYYTNLKSLHLCFPIRFRKLSNADQVIPRTLILVNNFFAHWIKEIDIMKYGTNKSLFPTTTPKEIYRCSDEMLKHLPKNALKIIETDLLYSKKRVIIQNNLDRRNHNLSPANSNGEKMQVTDENLDERTEKFGVQIDDKYVYRIHLKYFCDLGKINFLTKIDLKIRCTLETEMKNLFEKKKMLKPLKPGATAGSTNANDYGQATSPGTPDAQNIFSKAPFVQYKQILLSKNFRQYLETTMLSSKVLRMGIEKTPYQKTYELQAGSQEFTVNFKGSDRQFDRLEISLLYDKSDKHLTLYDSYNAECAARMIKSVELSNISDAYSATNLLNYDINNNTQKHLLWKQYVAWHCNGYTAAPTSDYINNPIFQELLLENYYFGNKSDEKIFVDLHDSMGCTDEIEKPSRNPIKLPVTIETKSLLAKKNEVKSLGLY